MTALTSLVALALPLVGQAPDAGDALRTVAEKTDYRATARHDDVMAWCRAFARATPNAHLTELGRTAEGRSIPMLIVADPPVKTAAEAGRSGKLVCLVIANIHAGEVCGKEALPLLLREQFAGPHPPLLKDLILAVAPIYNADGNERVSKTNRPGQVGPEEGMGRRANARGLDLNRDFVKLEAPETRALVKFLNEWDPHLFIDTHTTDGSSHRYTITYEGPKSPAGDPGVIRFMRRTFFPEAGKRFEKRTGLKAFDYGNFNRDHTEWTTYPAEPRYGTTYVGLRGRLSVLSEAYAYAPYKTRVQATRDFVLDCLETAAAHKDEIGKLLAQARGGTGADRPDPIAIRSRAKAAGEPATVLGYEERRDEDGRRVKPDTPKDYAARLVNEFEPAETVARPFAYLVPPEYREAVLTLRRHGLNVEELREDVELDVEAYGLDAVEKSPRRFEGHQLVELRVTPRPMARMVPAGTMVVRTSQRMGRLAVVLLEPRSEDGLATWNLLDAGLREGGDFPVLRLPKPASLYTTGAGPLPEDRGALRPITLRSSGGAVGRGRMAFGGPFIQWIDGAHWLQVRDGKLLRVEARTGRASPLAETEAITRSLARLSSIGEEDARSLARRFFLEADPGRRGLGFQMDPAHRGFLFEHGEDLYYATFDGKTAIRLTSQPGQEQFPKFSPDGQHVAYARDFDLYAVDLVTQKERRLTTGGREDLRHGHSDWVYFEEVWNRRWPAFWWSEDSKRLAFLEFNDDGVPYHTVLDDASSGASRKEERTHYPRAGEPNPKVRLGIVGGGGGPVQWADLSDYSPGAMLISEVGWFPDGSAYAYVQDRAQTWLDLVKVTPSSDGEQAATRRLFRDSTKAYIDSPGPLHPYKDRSFLWVSERDGWKHIYQYAADGALKARVTSGPWEVRRVEHVDDKEGWIVFTANREAPMSTDAYRVKLGGPVERLTQSTGTHTANVSPDGKLFLSSRSDIHTPDRIALYSIDGQRVRTVDSNLSHELKRLRFGPVERTRIAARDGFPLEAEVILPAEMEPGKKYPVWFTTYGGPHAPMVSDGWNGGRMRDHAMAHEGLIVFHMDPRSASGKGAVSTWAAYKHLGVQETKDIEDALNWLKEKPYVDGSRIGMSGHSYGGYITAYAMTHTGLFAAGIAGAPVTDWRDYDSIYTERYMGLPQDNPDGYNASSVVKAAGELHGRLLILHGAIDDNVSLRNSMRLVEALQRANKDFELMIYPSSRHPIFGPHYSRIQIDFIRRTLLAPAPGPDRPRSPGEIATPSPAEESRPRPEGRGRRRASASVPGH